MDTVSKYGIGNVWVSSLNIEETETIITEAVKDAVPKYVCVGNVRTTLDAQNDSNYCMIVNNALLNIPDGMPLIWAARLIGLKSVKRIAGGTLFSVLLKNKSYSRHFLLGDTEGTLQSLSRIIKSKHPHVEIVGMLSPSFKEEYSEHDYKTIANTINSVRPDIIWVSLGAPKQDIASYELHKLINQGVLIGIGAAFRYYLGEYRLPHPFFQMIGLTGLWWKVMRHPFASLIWYTKSSILFSTIVMKTFIKRLFVCH